jgi:RNA polymerase sigma-54 factor
VEQVDGAWVAELMEDIVPKFRWNARCVQMYSSCPAMSSFKATAKWLFRSIQRRKDLLTSIAKYLARKQGAFFEGCEAPKQLSASVLAEEFGVHESTIFRAISGKYMESPRGIVPLRLLVTASPNRRAKEMLQRLIEQEPFLEPLTDEKLALELEKSGYKVARRTIAKYRKQLNIGAASSRKHLI